MTALMLVAGATIGAETAAAGDVYVRVGAGLDRPSQTAFMDGDCSSVSPAALYGCGRGGDDAPRRTLGDFGDVGVLRAGLGYVVGPAVRVEALAEYRPEFPFEGTANFLRTGRRQSVEADLSSLSAMLAAHIDLPALGLPTLGPFRPFVGAGVGIARLRIGEMRMMFPRTTTVVPGACGSDVAWMLTAGAGVALGPHATLDVGWRYTDLGEVVTGIGDGRVVWRDGSREDLVLALAETRAKLRGHGLGLSLRYAF